MTSGVDAFFIFFFAGFNCLQGLLIALSALEILQSRATRMSENDRNVLSGISTPPISIIAPAYNEEIGIVDSVRSFLSLKYPRLEAIVVNDGSTDETLARLQQEFDLATVDVVVQQRIATEAIKAIYRSRRDPRLWVIDKAKSGKADTLNVGLNFCRTPLVCCVDADTLVEHEALLRMVEPFFYEPRRVLAVGGMVRVANGCRIEHGKLADVDLPRTWLGRFQIVEYLRSFHFGRLGLNRLGGNFIISGAFGLFLREALLEIGGYREDTVGEDMELVVRLHRFSREQGRPYRIRQIPDPVCYTEVPEQLGSLGRQRSRWYRGLTETLWAHRTMLCKRRYGAVGSVLYPFYITVEFVAPLVELAGYCWFAMMLWRGAVDGAVAWLYFLVAFFLGFLVSVQGLILDDLSHRFFRGAKVRMLLLVTAFFENLGYRQLTVLFRIQGLFRYLARDRSWGRIKRNGFRTAKAGRRRS